MSLPMNHSPLVNEGVKLPIELTHGDWFGVEDGCVHSLERDTAWSARALQSWEGITQNLWEMKWRDQVGHIGE